MRHPRQCAQTACTFMAKGSSTTRNGYDAQKRQALISMMQLLVSEQMSMNGLDTVA